MLLIQFTVEMAPRRSQTLNPEFSGISRIFYRKSHHLFTNPRLRAEDRQLGDEDGDRITVRTNEELKAMLDWVSIYLSSTN